MPFSRIHPALARALAQRDYQQPTPVQAAVLEADQARDLLVSAQTGSGKTVAFGLALAPALLGEAERFERGGAPLALVVAPTRELAMQVHRELSWLYAEAGGRILTCVGGMDPRGEARGLAGGCHIVVGTPGRLRDHLERGRLDASALRAVVLDEADEMLDLGFREDLEFILSTTPAERRTLLFSATIPKAIAALAQTYQRDCLRIDVASPTKSHADIEYRAVRVVPNEATPAVSNILRYFEARAAIVFCATRDGVRHLHANLVERGFAAVALSGELSQSERSHALQAIRDGRARVCVATDVAARGLDLPELTLVIHADLPGSRETLLHRSGRTGRAGRKGTCVLVVPVNRRRKAETLIASASITCAWSGPPTPDDIRQRDEERLAEDPIFSTAPSEEQTATARLLQARYSADEIALALAGHLRAQLPAAEDIADPGERRPPGAARSDRSERPERPSGARHEEHGEALRPTEGWSLFRLNVGRRHNADPRWLLPLICRHGGVTKRDIGAIRIGDRETVFEIASAAAAGFFAATRRIAEKGVRIEPAEEASAVPAEPPRLVVGAHKSARPTPKGARPSGPEQAGRKRFRKKREG